VFTVVVGSDKEFAFKLCLKVQNSSAEWQLYDWRSTGAESFSRQRMFIISIVQTGTVCQWTVVSIVVGSFESGDR